MAKKKPEDELDARGQITVELGGQEYVLRPSEEAVLAVERQIGPLYSLTTAAASLSLPIADMGVIVAEFMRAHGKANPDDPLVTDYKGAKAERCASLIYEAGAPRVCAKLWAVLQGALTGGYDASGEVKAPAMTTEKK